ncbi:MAG TPA: hypothetical protein VMP08_13765 [Anaerolineae bacterium]|nr:hypothetical protein [Anaerolineae bacterium]
MPNNADQSIEQWLWDAACSIRGAKDAVKYKDYVMPLVAKRIRYKLGAKELLAGAQCCSRRKRSSKITALKCCTN